MSLNLSTFCARLGILALQGGSLMGIQAWTQELLEHLGKC